VAAVERYMRIDHDAERKELDRRAAHIIDTIKGISTVQCDINVPEIANRVPHVMVRWDEATVGKSARQVVDEMLQGEPSIAISGGRENSITISVWQMQTGEAEIVASRLREVMG
jgi:L-seryl-tRNA(Ser) seleniumtransferase